MLIYELYGGLVPPGNESYLIIKDGYGWFCSDAEVILRCANDKESLWKLDNNSSYTQIANNLPIPYPSLEAFIDAKPELFI